MPHDEPPDNVLALFPGIDTTPFGVTSDPSPTSPESDDGWSATPERTIIDHDGLSNDTYQPEPSRQPDGQLAHQRRRTLPVPPAAVWAAIALLGGGLIDITHNVLTQRGSKPAASSTQNHTPPSSYRAGLGTKLSSPRTQIHRPHASPATHAPRTSERQGSSGRIAAPRPAQSIHRTVVATQYTALPSTPAVQTPATYQPADASTASGTPSPSATSGSSSPPAFGPAGTLGPGSSPNG